MIRRRTVLRASALTMAGLGVAGCASDAGGGVAADGTVTIELWHGQSSTGRKVIERLVADFEREHPKIRVDMGGGVLADAMLQKVMASLASGSYPDVAYIFGSDLASLARSPKVADLTGLTRRLTVPWKRFWPPIREAVTIDGQVRAAPALLDSLAVVCNKSLFAQAGLPIPRSDWTWREFVDIAKRLTDHDNGRFGTSWPGTGDEDTVWRLWPMIWSLGGDVIASDGQGIGFAETGVRALDVVRRLAADRSVYIDPKPGSDQMYQVFASGRMGMVVTGPWQLPDITQAGIDYAVVPLPRFCEDPISISGPDTWMLFDNGTARLRAAQTFVSWLIDPRQDVRWGVDAGSLPLSRDSENAPKWQRHEAETAGLSVFTSALETARVRPVHPAYPQISRALGQAIVAVLLGKSAPAQAMRACAETANAAILVPR